MAIFTRRDVQTAVNHLASSLTQQQLEKVIDRLNRTALECLAAEWEVIVYSAFRECGRITYERNLGGKTRPDVLFQLGESGNLEFLTDVRTISDKDIHEKNPYDDFCETIRRFLNKRGHTSAGLYFDVKDYKEGEYGKRKIRLTLPPKQDMNNFVEVELCQFLSGIARNPDKNDVLHYDKKGIRFSIRYNASEKRFSGGHHIGYTVPYSTRNPLTNALIEKGRQLMKSGYQGTKGIIICDGGCDALKERSQVNGEYGCQEIVKGYFRTHSYILWVLVLRIEQIHIVFPGETSVAIKPKLYWNSNQDKLLFRDTAAALERMVMHIPQPETTPTNAVHWLKGHNGKVGRPFGGYSMQNNTIKISARALTELLAGKVELQKFLEEHGFKPPPVHPTGLSFSFFERQIASGNTLQNSFVEKGNHKDDDWIVLEYKGPDPAISPFRVPK